MAQKARWVGVENIFYLTKKFKSPGKIGVKLGSQVGRPTKMA